MEKKRKLLSKNKKRFDQQEENLCFLVQKQNSCPKTYYIVQKQQKD